MWLQSCPELHHEDVEHESHQPSEGAPGEAASGESVVLAVSLDIDEPRLQQVQAMLQEVRPCHLNRSHPRRTLQRRTKYRSEEIVCLLGGPLDQKGGAAERWNVR